METSLSAFKEKVQKKDKEYSELCDEMSTTQDKLIEEKGLRSQAEQKLSEKEFELTNLKESQGSTEEVVTNLQSALEKLNKEKSQEVNEVKDKLGKMTEEKTKVEEALNQKVMKMTTDMDILRSENKVSALKHEEELKSMTEKLTTANREREAIEQEKQELLTKKEQEKQEVVDQQEKVAADL